MGHGIILPEDVILSTSSTEWHGLATVVETIDDETINPLLFPIIEGTTQIMVDGETIALPHHKALVADLRGRVELKGTEHQFAPLHMPKNSYQVIDNRAVWDALKESTKDLGVKVVTAGTLEGCKKFFMSVDIGGSEFSVNGDKFLSYLNFVTSHDGTLAMQAYDSAVRIVCLNTLRWSLEAAGKVGFKCYHSKNASATMVKLPELLSAVLIGRKDFIEYADFLDQSPLEQPDMLNITLNYLTTGADVDKISTRTLNSAEGIVNLAKNGMGNKGKTRYDLLNGFTEYYTHGDGVGKRSSLATKQYKAQFGSAADHKTDFAMLLRQDNDTWNKALERGKKIHSLIVS